MLPTETHGPDGPLLIMLHWLGGSRDTWTEVSKSASEQGLSCVALDLPGFGAASQLITSGVAATTDMIVRTIQSVRGVNRDPWLLMGHSMGGKFAAIVTRAALDGTPGLENLRGLILISPSPPGPEPMADEVRKQNIEALGSSTLDGKKDRDHAGSFIDANIGKLPFPESVRTEAVDILLRANRSAILDWFITGSREDWASRIGTLEVPALVLAGTTESALDPAAQRSYTLPHLPQATLVELTGAGHLSPLERPSELADRICAFAVGLRLALRARGTALHPDARALIEGDLTSPQTRIVLIQRLADDDLAYRDVLTMDECLTLRAIARRIVPGCPFDLSARVQRWLTLPAHDGWRHDSLPPDAEAWRAGLKSLDAAALHHYDVPFSALDAPRQDKLLIDARDGNLGVNLSHNLLTALRLGNGPSAYTAAQMSDWFGDLHAELTRLYVADPRTMHRIGFTGFADERGFTQIRLNEREEFER